MTERLENKSVQAKRIIAARLIGLIWPTRFRENVPGDLKSLDQILKRGLGAVGLTPHFSKGDFQIVLGALTLNSREFIKRPVLIPIAAHQRPPFLDMICNFAHIDLASLITPDTRHKEKQLQAQGKPIPWAGLDRVALLNQYLESGMRVVSEGGIDLFAPQAGRRDSLREFTGGPVGYLEKRAMEKNVELNLFPLGLEISGATDYSACKGYNVRRTYCVTLGRVIPGAKIEGDIDQWAYQTMSELAPPAYKPQRIVRS